MKKSPLITLLALISLLVATAPKKATAKTAVQIAPTYLDCELQPGETYVNQTFNIFNPSHSETQVMEPHILDLFVEDETGSYKILEEPHKQFALSKWVAVSPQKVTLEPLEIQKLTLTITPPKNAEPGGHYAMLLVPSHSPEKDPEEPKGVLVQPVGGVGVPLLTTIPGEISWEGQLLEFLPIPFKNLGPVDFKLRFQNTGTVHYKPYGKIEIFDFLGNRVGEIEILPTRVFPQTIRRLETTWERLLLIGKYRAKATLHYGKEGEEKTGTAEIAFWAFPYKAAAILLLTVLIVRIVAKLRERDSTHSSPSPPPLSPS